MSLDHSSSDLWQLIHSAYGDELGLTSDDEADYVQPPGIGGTGEYGDVPVAFAKKNKVSQ